MPRDYPTDARPPVSGEQHAEPRSATGMWVPPAVPCRAQNDAPEQRSPPPPAAQNGTYAFARRRKFAAPRRRIAGQAAVQLSCRSDPHICPQGRLRPVQM